MSTKITTGDGNVALACPGHVYSKQVPLTAELAVEIGQHYRIFTGSMFGYEALAEAQGCETGDYSKTAALTDKNALPQTGYARTKGGTLKYDDTWHVYTAQPDNKDWQAYHLAQLKKLPRQSIFSDSIMLSYYQGGVPYKPSGYTTAYTVPEWLRLLKADIDTWAAATGKRIIINGLTKQSMGILTPTVGMIENAFGSSKGTLPTAKQWTTTFDLLLAAQAQGWTPWVYAKLHTDTPALRDTWRRLLAPTMLLADEGSLLFELGGSEGDAQPWVSQEYAHPWYQPGIGKPVNHAYQDSQTGAWVRSFEDGYVIVNPSTAGVSQVVEPGYDGFPVPAQSGTILRKSYVSSLAPVPA